MSSGRTPQGGQVTSGPGSPGAREGGPGLAPAPDITPEGLTAALAQADDAAFAAEFAAEIAAQARGFVDGAGEIAAGGAPETAIAELLVLLAQVNLAGAMLGAVADVVPQAKFEPDAGLDPDADPLREGLAALLEGLDDYAYVFDPLLPEQPTTGRVSDDVADICLDLAHGLRHYDAGATDEALWWWQFSYLSNWGDHALSAQRALLSVVAHQRLDADEIDAQAAEADALLSD
jgi:hypothetical protein